MTVIPDPRSIRVEPIMMVILDPRIRDQTAVRRLTLLLPLELGERYKFGISEVQDTHFKNILYRARCD
ncbi:hypothetical protein RRG08_059155 [Elysia crispata]|uniref:Uncharacterized protein n=1 Tax=Elysia crispata TaxID=231223 RepID=A0AAE1DNX4_9GAST|nr:hypothetical protein RRG08_059155 [Elysia crispata]